MFGSSTILLACSLLSYVSAAPAGLSNLQSLDGTLSNAPLPSWQLTLDKSQIRNRRFMMEASAPQVQPPMSKQMACFDSKVGKPSIEQSEKIENYLKHCKTGKAYKVPENGDIYPMPKSDSTYGYIFGKVQFYDDCDRLIHETGCCYGKPSDREGYNAMESCCIVAGACYGCICCTAFSAILKNYRKVIAWMGRELGLSD
ncbi:hypothetical protein PSTG_14123 [Puccinia striiformis f. sp. tritici PST-78]|uniref:Secreted protein n=1 Tax=Puccinia striiformis f. sp. tritici PST-78 TaxID=1165861 RepID=A0A0L0UZM2_9BASI|nr:hypothetical protein PSTG_14123 [Puccinia striiformis f. sp. tritici PST-78]